MNKIIILFSLASLLSLQSLSQPKKKKGAGKASPDSSTMTISTTLDSVSYALGSNISQDLKLRGFTELNYDLLAKAMEGIFSGKESLLSKEQSQKVIMAALAKAKKAKFASTLAESLAFLEENKKKPGVIVLPSGLQYEVLQEGTGDKPQATDYVTVHYKGTLINGKQFDSSYDRKEPTSFPLGSVIRGWTEGVPLMSIGSKYRFVIPHELAYGENGAGESIPPYSVLIFEIELIKIGK